MDNWKRVQRRLRVVACLGVAMSGALANAQERMLTPPSILPFESGALDRHVELVLGYTPTPDRARTPTAVTMALDARWTIFDRLELGLNIPFLEFLGQPMRRTAFGDLSVLLKGKLYGDSAGPLAVSVFANAALPTDSNAPTRDYAILHMGLAVSVAHRAFSLSVDLGSYWLAWEGEDFVAMQTGVFTALRLHRVVAAYLGVQTGLPVTESGMLMSFAVCPGIRITPYRGLRLDVAARIAPVKWARTMVLGTDATAGLALGVGYSF